MRQPGYVAGPGGKSECNPRKDAPKDPHKVQKKKKKKGFHAFTVGISHNIVLNKRKKKNAF